MKLTRRTISISKFIQAGLGCILVAGLEMVGTGVATAQSLGKPTFSGNGCLPSKVSATLSPDQSALSVLFDGFGIYTSRGSRVGTSMCRISIPVGLDEAATGLRIQYRAFQGADGDGKGGMSIRYVWRQNEALEAGPRFTFEFRGPTTDNVFESHLIGRSRRPVATLEIEICLRGGGWFSNQEVKTSIDSLDVAPERKK